MSSTARPMRLNARTVSTTHTPGEPRYHHAPCEMAPEENACSRIEPHDTAVQVWLDPKRHDLPVRATQKSGAGDEGYELRLLEVRAGN